ncbi:MAG: neutral/alkaline non-lysosomal ceramidase N-terminal domain-containing protein [Armatimonadota bacterium]
MQAGTAIRDISPRKPAFLVGYPHVDRISEGIHDPLLASALCLRNGAAAVMLIALDLLLIEPSTARDLRRRVAARTGIPQEGVFISCSHTHSGPNTADLLGWGPSPVVPAPDAEYMEFLAEAVAAAAGEAAENLRDAEAAWCTAQARGVGGNRHDPERGAVDPEVGLLAVRDAATKRLFALSLIYSMHPTVMHEDSRLVSADFPYYTREFLKERFGPELAVLYHNGPEGNQSPRYHVQAQTFAEAQRLGELLGASVAEGLSALRDEDFTADPVLDARLAQVELPRRVFPTVEEAEQSLAGHRARYEELKRSGAPHGPVRTAECDVFGAEETAYLAACQQNGLLDRVLAQYTPIDVQAIRVGDACLLGFPGELFVEYSLEAKRRAGFKVFPVTLVNGDTQGYIITRETIEKGYYESNNRVFEPEAGSILVEAGLTLLQEMIATNPASR